MVKSIFNSELFWKNLIFMLIIFLIFSCKLTKPNPSNESGYEKAELVLANDLNEVINISIYDGTADTLHYEVSINGTFSHSWYDYETVFTDLDGVLTIRYRTYSISEKVIKLRLDLGHTLHYSINDQFASLTLYNNTDYDINFTLDDGSLQSDLERTLFSEGIFFKKWDINDSFFLINNGIAFLTYQNQFGEEMELTFILEIGDNEFYQIDDNDYTLKVSNTTNSDVWFHLDDHAQSYMNPDEFQIFFQSYFSDINRTHIHYSGYHVFSNEKDIYINAFTQTDFNIVVDGGAINIANNSDILIIEFAYISPSSDSIWGYNDLSDFIYPEESAIWTVETGYWDILVIDNNSIEYIVYDSNIWLDETLNFSFPQDFSISKNIQTRKIHKVGKNSKKIEGKKTHRKEHKKSEM